MDNISDTKELCLILNSALEIDTLTFESSMDDIEEWDSLGHLSILAALDSRLDGKIADISALAEASSVVSIFEILTKHKLM
jgi:acyl carrier protein